jgi:hypothetical protein
VREICDHARHRIRRRGLVQKAPQRPDPAQVTVIRVKSSYQGPPLAAHMDTGRKMPSVIKVGEVTW